MKYLVVFVVGCIVGIVARSDDSEVGALCYIATAAVFMATLIAIGVIGYNGIVAVWH